MCSTQIYEKRTILETAKCAHWDLTALRGQERPERPLLPTGTSGQAMLEGGRKC